MKLNNKKGIGFFYIFAVLMIIVLGQVIIFISDPMEETSTYSKNSFELAEKLDILNMKSYAEDFYKKEEIIKEIEKQKQKFSNLEHLSTDIKLERIDSDCKGNTWLNEKNLFENSKNTDENSKKILDCTPDFDEDISELIVESIKEGMNIEIENSLKTSLEIDELSVDFDSLEDTKYTLEVKTTYNIENQAGAIKKQNIFKLDYDLSLYPQLLLTLQKVIPKISEKNKNFVPSCLSENDLSNTDKSNSEELLTEETCIALGIEELIKNEENGNELLKNYNFNVKINELEKDQSNMDSLEFFELEVFIENKKNKNEKIEFKLILKDNIPNTLISFSVKNSELGRNLVELIISEPKLQKDKILSYLVFYSEENFFDKNTYSKYDDLFYLLENSLIPKSFEESLSGDLEANSVGYRHSSIDTGLNLNLMLISNSGFDDDSGTKTSYIHQIFNPDTNKYELLKENTDLYVFVFAIDSNFNYYLNEEEISKKIKRITVINPFGPRPLDYENFKHLEITGDVTNFEKSLKIDVNSYESEGFNYYRIYLSNTKDFEVKEITTPCSLGNLPCFIDEKISDLNPKILLTSDISILDSKVNIDDIEYSVIKTNPLILNDLQIYFSMVPYNINNKGFDENKFVLYFTQETTDKKSYDLVKGEFSKFEESRKYDQVEIKDNKAPHPKDSIIVQNIEIFGSSIALRWDKNVNQDVSKLTGFLKKYDLQGNEVGFPLSINIGFDGYLMDRFGNQILIEQGISKYKLYNILPEDSKGNPLFKPTQMEDLSTYYYKELIIPQGVSP